MIKLELVLVAALLATCVSGQDQQDPLETNNDPAQDQANPGQTSYSGYSVFRVWPQKEHQLNGLRKLREGEIEGIEFWTEPSHVNQSVDIMVAPSSMFEFTDALKHLRLATRRTITDVGETIRRTYPEVVQARGPRRYSSEPLEAPTESQSALEFYSKFQSYANIEQRLHELDRSDPRISLQVAGLSSERRNLYLVKVSGDHDAKKPVIFIDAGHHAREWIGHSTLMWLLESLVSEKMPIRELSKYSYDANCRSNNHRHPVAQAKMERLDKNNDLSFLLDRFDIWFVPVVNPDGYVYSHTTDRLWRKTRSKTSAFFDRCVGADPNRNYNFHWAEAGASRVPCSDTFAGAYAHSEPEVAMIAGLLTKNSDRIKMYISLHAFSQLILMPNGWHPSEPSNAAELHRVARAGKQGFAKLRGTNYREGSAAIMLYEAAGGSDDFAHGVANISLSYTIELPDTGCHGFLMPPHEIMYVAQEASHALRAMADAIHLDDRADERVTGSET